MSCGAASITDHLSRLQDTIQNISTSDVQACLYPASSRRWKIWHYYRRSRHSPPKTSYRSGTGSSKPWFLQSYLPSQKEERQVAHGHRPQRSDQTLQVQDGNTSLHQKCRSAGRLCGLSGPDGCLSAHPSSQVLKKIPQIRHKRSGVSMVLPSIRLELQSTDIHDGDGSRDGGNKTEGQHVRLGLPGRLPAQRSEQGNSSHGVEFVSQTNQGIRLAGQHRQVHAGTVSRFLPRRHAVSNQHQRGMSPRGQNCQALSSGSRFLHQEDGFSQGLPRITGHSECSSGSRGFGQTPHETSAVSSLGPLEAESPSVEPSCCDHGCSPEGVPTMARRPLASPGCGVVPEARKPYIDGRCIFVGLGRRSSPHGDGSERFLGSEPSILPYQSAGIIGSDASSRAVPVGCPSLSRYGENGQHDSGLLYPQTGRYKESRPYGQSVGFDVVVSPPRHHSLSIPHCRSPQCPSRHALESPATGFNRVVTSSVGVQTGPGTIRSFQYRPICHLSEQQTSDVCIPLPGSKGMGRGRNELSMGEHEGLRLSTVPLNTEGHKQDQIRPSSNFVNSSMVANQVMDKRPTRVTGRFSKGASNLAQALETTQKSTVSRKRGVTVSARLALVRKAIRNKAFSRAVSARIAEPRRHSSTRLYNAKWRVFCKWAQEHDVLPTEATVQSVADFLLYLFRDLSLSPSTIKGYRAALSDTYALLGKPDVGKNPYISRLIKSFDRDRPRIRSLAPKWNLSWVLHCLAEAPFEPMYLADIKFVSYKTAFLLAFASAKRVCELHALSVLPSCCRVSKLSATLTPEPGFMAKNETPDHHPPPIILHRLTEISDDEQSRRLCPLRALRIYLSRTKGCRNGRQRLFLPIKKGVQNISKASIARWICQAVLLSYKMLSDRHDLRQILRVNAHELRAVSASWSYFSNCSLKDVMAAAFWRSETVFSSFYLRSLQAQAQDLFQLGPFTTAQLDKA